MLHNRRHSHSVSLGHTLVALARSIDLSAAVIINLISRLISEIIDGAGGRIYLALVSFLVMGDLILILLFLCWLFNELL
jgi:hypothetical protein